MGETEILLMRRRAGIIPILIAALLIFVIVVVVLAVNSQETQIPPIAVTQAQQLASTIRTFPVINGTSCNDALAAVLNANSMIASLDGVIGTNLKQVTVDPSVCSTVTSFLPMVTTYNQVVLSARSLNPNDQSSVKRFYVNIFLLAGELTILNDSIAYKAAFRATGELNDALALGKIRSICGDECYSAVLSQLHWFIRDYANQFLSDFESWASSYLK